MVHLKVKSIEKEKTARISFFQRILTTTWSLFECPNERFDRFLFNKSIVWLSRGDYVNFVFHTE